MSFRHVGRIARATSAYAVEFTDPIEVKVDDVIDLGRRDTQWPDFIWCTSADGKSGWVAEDIFERHGEVGYVSRDYSARELPVEEDEIVTVEEEYGGWSWCTNSRGDSGWVPNVNLSP